MTLREDQLGDKGQRYEVRYVHRDKPGNQVMGWTDSKAQADLMVNSFSKAPYVKLAWVHDRKESPNDKQ